MMTLLHRLQAAIDRVTAGLNVLGTLLILALMILINVDVIGRGVFLSPVSGVPELVSMSIVAIVFLQVGQAFRMGRFTRTDALINALQSRVPRVRAFLELVYCAIGCFIIAVLFQASHPLFTKAWDRGTFVGTVGDFIAPIWPVKLIILIGCSALLLQLAMSTIRAGIQVYSGGDTDKTVTDNDPV